MPDVATSLHLHNVHELMILAPLRQGFVEQDERRVSYSTRLKALLNLLFRPSQSTSERTLMPTLNFSEDLRNLYHFDYGVVDRLQQSQLILNATFDSSWEMYFHNLVDKVGPFLDAVFFHCEGFENRSCADGYDKFAEFIREHQVQTGMLYTATPELTADDLRLLRPHARGENVKTPLVSVKDQIALDKAAWKARYQHEAWQGPAEYTRLRLQSITQFFLSVWETRRLFTPSEMVGKRSAQAYFDSAVRFLASAVVGKVVPDANGAIATVEIDQVDLPFAVLKDQLLAGEKDLECEAWLENVLKPEAPKPAADAAIVVSDAPNAENVQNGILEPRETNSALLSFLRLPKKDVAKFLNLLRDGVSPNPNAKWTINAGFTYAGLRRIGLGDETCELLPKEFQEGMEQRAGVLGDLGWPSHPDYWRPIGAHGWFSISSIDLVVVFHFEKADAKAAIVEDARGLLRRWIGDEHDECLVHSEFVDRPDVDPFGFKAREKARQSQPKIDAAKRTSGDVSARYDNLIAPGNLILGYCDHRGSIASLACGDAPSCDLFKDGTFLVVRKLAQNRPAFRRLQGDTKDDAFEEATLGKHVADDRTYDDEPEKAYHPNSHLRRSNPRLSGVPRIVRQSYTYCGGKDGDRDSHKDYEHGHMFMCYCASIAEQFEVIQRWINGGNSTGLLSSDHDLLAGQHAIRKKLNPDEKPHVPAVTLRWGMYLFVPSKRALELLAEVAERGKAGFLPTLKRAEQQCQAKRGAALLEQLRSIADAKVAQQSWKQLFEEAAFARDARAIWAAIREQGGRLDTPYGTLLGTRDLVKEVLENKGDTYSVREYRERFLTTAGDFYLGLDECPAGRSGHAAPGLASYLELAQANVAANAVLSTQAARERAGRFALDFLKRNDRGRFDVKQLVKHVIGNLCAEFTGVPSSVGKDEGLREFLNYFVAITRYSSFPYPEKWVAERAARAGAELVRAYGADPSTWTGKLKEELQRKQYGSPQAIRDAIIIANVGFVPPAISMLTGMLSKWLNNGDIQQPRLRDDAGARSAILHEMRSDATFTTIYRTKIESGCHGDPSPGKYVVVGVQSAYVEDEQSGAEDPQRWMFGGTYAEPKPGASRGAHACPMQTQAIEIIIGVATAVAAHVHARAKEDCALIRLSPFTYEFEKIGRRLPGAYLEAAEVAGPPAEG